MTGECGLFYELVSPIDPGRTVISIEADASAVVGLLSPCEVLLQSGLEQMCQFINIVTQKTARAGWPLLASMNAQSHDDRTRNAISTRFDCILETRTDDGRNEFRVRTATDEPSAWTPIVPAES